MPYYHDEDYYYPSLPVRTLLINKPLHIWRHHPFTSLIHQFTNIANSTFSLESPPSVPHTLLPLFSLSFFSRYYISYITFRLLCHHPPWQNSIRIWLQCGRPGFDSMPNHTSSSHTCIDIMFYGQTYVISCCQCNASYIGNLKAWYLYLTLP